MSHYGTIDLSDPATTAALSIPTQRLVAATIASNYKSKANKTGIPAMRGVGSGKCQSLFDLGNDGATVALIAYNNSSGALYSYTVYWNGTSLVTRDYTLALAGDIVHLWQGVADPSVLYAIDINGKFVSIDYSAVLTATADPTVTTLIADVEDVAAIGATLTQGSTTLKWIGDDDTAFLAVNGTGTTITASTYKNTAGTWALVDQATATVTSYTRNQATCNYDQRAYDDDHLFAFHASTNNWQAAKVSLDVDLNVTIDVATQGALSGVPGQLRYVGNGNIQMLYGSAPYNTATLLFEAAAITLRAYSTTFLNNIPGRTCKSEFFDILASNTVTSTSLAVQGFTTFGAFNTQDLATVTSGYSGFPDVLFTGPTDDPFKYLWTTAGTVSGAGATDIALTELPT